MFRTTIAGIGLLVVSAASAQDLGGANTTVYGPFVEFDLANNSWSGSPFDVDATATFTHTPSGSTFTHRLFYEGPNTNNWKLRFTGTKLGEWTFRTNSVDAELNGRSGKINVAAAPNARGFTVGAGNQWAQQRGDGSLVAIAPQLVMYERETARWSNQKIDADLNTFFKDHGFTGLHVPSIGGQFFNYNQDGAEVNSGMKDPDPRTFEALERLILKTHEAGGHTHLWAWGDRQRGQTPDNLEGGINGEIDVRLQKYIAARLGPLPGWSMGYGFDLNEWAGASHSPYRVNLWEENVNDESGYDHLLGGRSNGPNRTGNFSEDELQQVDIEWNSNFGYSGYEHQRPSYAEYIEIMNAKTSDGNRLLNPQMSEDRFRVRSRAKDYTEQETVRGMWHSMMAGGVSNIWGNLQTSSDGGSGEYSPNIQQRMQTWKQFWFEEGRFRLGMVADNSLTPDPTKTGENKSIDIVGTVVLRDDEDLLVFYSEDTDVMNVDLTDLATAYNAVAVNTLAEYQEIDLGVITGQQAIRFESSGDWVVAMTPVPEPTTLLPLGVVTLTYLAAKRESTR
jgi:hypothetical protein